MVGLNPLAKSGGCWKPLMCSMRRDEELRNADFRPARHPGHHRGQPHGAAAKGKVGVPLG